MENKNKVKSLNNIKFLSKPYSKEEILDILEDEIKLWFLSKYKDFTPPQKYSLVEIHKKRNVLISSPTGSGKTLSAFLSILNELLKLEKRGELKNEIYAVYVSPLRALNNDIRRNLEEPLREIEELIGRKLGIRVAIRTSDTSSYEKSKMLKKVPHILITTPESLAISLNSPRFSQLYKSVKYIIVDEIHSLADNKRGSHLSLSIERLENISEGELTRVGLSATVSPLEDVALFLVGSNRKCNVVDVNYLKDIEIKVKSPVDDFIYTPAEVISKKLYSLLDELIQQHRTTLIFTNTRGATERVVFHLKEKFPEEYKELISAHHSSLSKSTRLEVEEQLKRGELKVVVSSTSLELGIDIGNIDLVVLLGSPKSVSRAMQRIGRSGHKLHEKSYGVMVVLDRDDMIEDIIIANNALNKKFDKIRIPEKPLDVLAQHILGMSLEKVWDIKEALSLIKRAYPYRDLTMQELERVLNFLAGNYEELEERNIYAKIWYEDGKFGKRGKLGRALYYMNVGTIPDESYVKVMTRGGKYVGKVEEEFAERLVTGDIFVLGGKTYEFVYSRANVLYVDAVEGRKPTIPSWFSEMLPLSYEVALDIERFRVYVSSLIKRFGEKKAREELMKQYSLEDKLSNAVVSYIKEQMIYSEIPGEVFLVEHFEDENKNNNYIFHTMAGRKANEALARVFAYLASSYKQSNVRMSFNDYGVMLTLPRFKKLSETNIKDMLNLDEKTFKELVVKSLENSELFRRRFRQVAVRSLAILRRYPKRNRELSLSIQQMSADALLKLLKMYYPSFPVLEETFKETTKIAMHIDEAYDYLKRSRSLNLVFKRDLKLPSPFAFNLVASSASDVVLMEDRKRFIEEMHRKLMSIIKGENGENRG